EGARGERTVEGDTCERVAEATAVILAFAIDADRAAARAGVPPQSSASPQTKPTPPAPTVASPPEPRPGKKPARAPAPPTPKTAERVGLMFAAGGMADVGSLPALAGGVDVRLGMSLRRLAAYAVGQFWPARFGASPQPGKGVDVWLLT